MYGAMYIPMYILPLPTFFSHEHSKAAEFQKQFNFPTIFNEKLFLFISYVETSTIVKMELEGNENSLWNLAMYTV